MHKFLSNFRSVKNIIISFVLLLLTILFVFFVYSTYTLLFTNTIYPGVNISGLNVGGLTKQQAESLLTKKFSSQAPNIQFLLNAENISTNFSYKDIDVIYRIKQSVESAYYLGRSGNLLNRYVAIAKIKTSHEDLPLEVTYSSNTLMSHLNKIHKNIFIPVVENRLITGSNDYVKIITGHKGKTFDIKTLRDKIDSQIRAGNGSVLNIPIQITHPKQLDVDEYYKKIYVEPQSARIIVIDNETRIIPHVIGRSISRRELGQIINWLKNTENQEKVLPVAFLDPPIKSEDIPKYLFRDELSTYSTRFYTGNTNDTNRGVNIRLAVSKITGKLIPPNSIFSFNQAIGPREKEMGYQDAHTYVGGKIIDGVGGGICQVSTTFYNAAIRAGLDISERDNHMFTVGYVPYGSDAAVAYGAVDLRMKNKSNWPLRIESWVTSDNQLFFKLVGTNEHIGRAIDLRHVQISTSSPTVEYIYDPNLGEKKQVQIAAGMQGYTIDTFKVVKQDGVVVKDEKLYRSTYQAHSKQIKIGTKKFPTSVSTKQPESSSIQSATVTSKPTASSDKPVALPTPIKGSASTIPSISPTTEVSSTPIPSVSPNAEASSSQQTAGVSED